MLCRKSTDLTSKTVFAGFIAAWFLAASPTRRSSSVKETNEGVVKLPCSLATVQFVRLDAEEYIGRDLFEEERTNFDIGTLVVGNA